MCHLRRGRESPGVLGYTGTMDGRVRCKSDDRLIVKAISGDRLLIDEVCDESHQGHTVMLIVSLVHATKPDDGALHDEFPSFWKLRVHLNISSIKHWLQRSSCDFFTVILSYESQTHKLHESQTRKASTVLIGDTHNGDHCSIYRGEIWCCDLSHHAGFRETTTTPYKILAEKLNNTVIHVLHTDLANRCSIRHGIA